MALGLFHKDKDVRMKVVDLLERISEHEAGRHWWKALSRFEKLAYYRIRREADAELKIIKGELGEKSHSSNGQAMLVDQRKS